MRESEIWKRGGWSTPLRRVPLDKSEGVVKETSPVRCVKHRWLARVRLRTKTLEISR